MGYVGKLGETTLSRSQYLGTVPHTFEEKQTLFLDICPFRYSFVQPYAKAAFDLPTGTGYYESFGKQLWWSTNFKNTRDDPARFYDESGYYYSKNTATIDGHVMMGIVTVVGNDVSLKWGYKWGTVSRNAAYDSQVVQDGVTRRLVTTYAIPQLDVNTVDVQKLELEVMRNAPTNGAFVYLDLDHRKYYYGCVDGDPDMYAVSPGGTKVVRDDDEFPSSPYPITSRFQAEPVFDIGNFQMRVVTGRPTYYQRFLTAKPQRTSNWLKFNPDGASMDWGGDNIASDDPNQVHAQSYSNAAVLVGYRGAFITKGTDGPLRSINLADPVDVYGSWLAVGASTQRVGWIGNGSYFGISDWGMTSLSPAASVNGSSSFDPLTSDVQNEILDNIPGSAEIGFIFDASIGYFGRVFWISML